MFGNIIVYQADDCALHIPITLVGATEIVINDFATTAQVQDINTFQ